MCTVEHIPLTTKNQLAALRKQYDWARFLVPRHHIYFTYKSIQIYKSCIHSTYIYIWGNLLHLYRKMFSFWFNLSVELHFKTDETLGDISLFFNMHSFPYFLFKFQRSRICHKFRFNRHYDLTPDGWDENIRTIMFGKNIDRRTFTRIWQYARRAFIFALNSFRLTCLSCRCRIERYFFKGQVKCVRVVISLRFLRQTNFRVPSFIPPSSGLGKSFRYRAVTD